MSLPFNHLPFDIWWCHMSHGCVKFLPILQDEKTHHTVQCSEAWGRVRRRRRARPPSMQGNSSLRLSSFCSSRESISSLQWVGSQLLAAPKASVVPWISDSSQCAIQSANENKSELACLLQGLEAAAAADRCSVSIKRVFFFRENTMWFRAIITWLSRFLVFFFYREPL